MPTTKGIALLRVETSPALRRRLKVRAAELGVSMQQYAAEAVERRLTVEDARKGGVDGGREG